MLKSRILVINHSKRVFVRFYPGGKKNKYRGVKIVPIKKGLDFTKIVNTGSQILLNKDKDKASELVNKRSEMIKKMFKGSGTVDPLKEYQKTMKKEVSKLDVDMPKITMNNVVENVQNVIEVAQKMNDVVNILADKPKEVKAEGKSFSSKVVGSLS